MMGILGISPFAMALGNGKLRRQSPETVGQTFYPHVSYNGYTML